MAALPNPAEVSRSLIVVIKPQQAVVQTERLRHRIDAPVLTSSRAQFNPRSGGWRYAGSAGGEVGKVAAPVIRTLMQASKTRHRWVSVNCSAMALTWAMATQPGR